MNRTFSLLLLGLALSWPVSVYSQSDSIRVELTQEPLATDSTRQSNPERIQLERRHFKEFLRRSRREVTLFELGFECPVGGTSGVLLFPDDRPKIEKTSTFSLWAGIEQKITPSWAIMGGIGWQFSPKTNQSTVSGTSWLGQIGLNYYPTILKAIRTGKSANNFYHQVYITGRALLPFHDRLTVNDANPSRTITANAFQQATMLGVGIRSTRTRLFFYNIVFGAAYLFGRDEGIQHPVQFMNRISVGIGL